MLQLKQPPRRGSNNVTIPKTNGTTRRIMETQWTRSEKSFKTKRNVYLAVQAECAIPLTTLSLRRGLFLCKNRQTRAGPLPCSIMSKPNLWLPCIGNQTLVVETILQPTRSQFPNTNKQSSCISRLASPLPSKLFLHRRKMFSNH